MNWSSGKALLLGTALLGFGLPGLRSVAEKPNDICRDATVAAVQQVMPSVVNIATRKVVAVQDPFEAYFRQFLGLQPTRAMISLGSGVIIDEAGYLLTNDHVVRRATEIQVQLNTSESTNRYYRASVVASDPKTDVALLKIDAPPGTKFKAIKFAPESDLYLGETVLALGNPFGLGGSVSRGILSSKSRNMPKEGAPLDIPNWLQTDAPINPGNSGGPLVNLRGELIGINVAVLNEIQGEPAQGIGFAIPIRLVEESLADIFPTESIKSYWFGARVKVGTSPLVVASVQPHSPAGRAGLLPGDAILKVNGKEPKSFIDFADLVAADPASDALLTVRRGGQLEQFAVKLVPDKTVFNSDLIRKRLGAVLEPRTVRLGQSKLKVFAIRSVQPGGPADKAGLQPDMLVTMVDGQVPDTVVDVAKLLYRKSAGNRMSLGILMLRRQGDFGYSLEEQDVPVTLR